MTLLNNATNINRQTVFHCPFKNAETVAFREHSLTTRAVDYTHISNIQSTNYSIRSYLCASRKLRGSVTLEAAIALPIFMFFFIALTSVINLIYVQLTIQIQLEETARILSQTSYVAYMTQAHNAQTDSVTDNLALTALSIATIQNTFMDENMKSFLDASLIKNGYKGVNFLSTSVDSDEGLIDLVLTYSVNIPFIPENVFSFKLSNRCYFRSYIGTELSEKQSSDDIYVYYTVYGQVYHTQKYCKYLLNYSKVIPFNDIDHSFYEPCKLCTDRTLDTYKKENPPMYITESGQAFHITLSCPSFTGNIFRMPYSSMPSNSNICSECLKGK